VTAWAAVPVAADGLILAAQFDEARLAINERYNAAGLADPALVDVATNGDQPLAILTSYRAAIDAIIPYYANPALNYIAFTKAACLTAAIGAANWIPALPGDLTMYTGQINDMRTVLNTLSWVRLLPTIADADEYWSYPGFDGNDISWAQAWTDAQAAYAVAADSGWGDQVGFFTDSYSPSPPSGETYYKSIWVSQFPDISYLVANIPVAGTKMEYFAWDLGDAMSIDFHQAAAFGGAATALSTQPAGRRVQNCTAVAPGGARHYSARNNPAGPDPLTYPPADVDGATRGGYLYGFVLLVQHTFSYS
jgi:hypothetical protein